MDITFSIPHAFSADSPLDENSDVLRILLDCLVRINQAYLRNHAVPALYQSGVRYGRTILWEPIPAVLERGYGDCKSLAPWLIAEYGMRGIPCTPVFRFIYRDDGLIDFHIIVRRDDLAPSNPLAWEDPSRKLGMGTNENGALDDSFLRSIYVDPLPGRRRR